ncbi:putative jacalin-like lectin domain superfamily [Helianthus debilis subsp. tardiflorus]
MLKLGPKEMKGEIWDEKGSTEILEILTSHQQDSINSIQFTCNTDGEVFLVETHGEPTGLKFLSISLPLLLVWLPEQSAGCRRRDIRQIHHPLAPLSVPTGITAGQR